MAEWAIIAQYAGKCINQSPAWLGWVPRIWSRNPTFWHRTARSIGTRIHRYRCSTHPWDLDIIYILYIVFLQSSSLFFFKCTVSKSLIGKVTCIACRLKRAKNVWYMNPAFKPLCSLSIFCIQSRALSRVSFVLYDVTPTASFANRCVNYKQTQSGRQPETATQA